MAKYRAVLLVPSIVEFEDDGTTKDASEQLVAIAASLGRTRSMHPRQKDTPNEIYMPKILECILVSGEPLLEAA